MLQPARQKYRKQFRGRRGGIATRGQTLSFGEFGLKALESGWITSAQIEASRRAIAHITRRGGKIWIRIFPDKAVTQKSAGVRMGGGKGDIDHYVAVIKSGRMLFELAGVSRELAHQALHEAGAKLPVNTKIVSRT